MQDVYHQQYQGKLGFLPTKMKSCISFRFWIWSEIVSALARTCRKLFMTPPTSQNLHEASCKTYQKTLGAVSYLGFKVSKEIVVCAPLKADSCLVSCQLAPNPKYYLTDGLTRAHPWQAYTDQRKLLSPLGIEVSLGLTLRCPWD